MLDDLKNRQRGCSIFLHQLVQEILNDAHFRFIAFPTRWRALAHRLLKRQRQRRFLIIIGRTLKRRRGNAAQIIE